MSSPFGKLMFEAVVRPDWLDELDHVNFLQHQRVADGATKLLWERVGGPPFSSMTPVGVVMVDVHARYQREIRLGDRVEVYTGITKHDHRRIWLRHTLVCNGVDASTVDIVALCFDAARRRASIWPDPMLASFSTWNNDSDRCSAKREFPVA